MTLKRLLISLRYCLHRVGSELGLARNVGPRSERLIFVINCGESVSGWATRADRPTILFVFGMARSGTSALTRALSLLRRRVAERNAWRRQAQSARILGTAGIHFLSRTILQRHDSTWWKPDVLDVTSFDVRDHLAALRGIKAYLAELPSASTVVIKHIVPLAELWFEACETPDSMSRLLLRDAIQESSIACGLPA